MWNWDFCSGWAFWSRFSRFCECPLRSKSLNSSFLDVIRRGKLRLHPRLWLKVSHCDSKYKNVRAMNKFFFKISEFLFFLLKKLKNHQKFKFPAKFSPWSLKILVFLLKIAKKCFKILFVSPKKAQESTKIRNFLSKSHTISSLVPRVKKNHSQYRLKNILIHQIKKLEFSHKTEFYSNSFLRFSLLSTNLWQQNRFMFSMN